MKKTLSTIAILLMLRIFLTAGTPPALAPALYKFDNTDYYQIYNALLYLFPNQVPPRAETVTNFYNRDLYQVYNAVRNLDSTIQAGGIQHNDSLWQIVANVLSPVNPYNTFSLVTTDSNNCNRFGIYSGTLRNYLTVCPGFTKIQAGYTGSGNASFNASADGFAYIRSDSTLSLSAPLTNIGGRLEINDGSAVPGYVFTALDSLGHGNWQAPGGGGTAGSGINLTGDAINLGAYLTSNKTTLNLAINTGDTVALVIGDSVLTPDGSHYIKGVGLSDNFGMFSGIVDASPFGGSNSTYILGNLNYYQAIIDTGSFSINTPLTHYVFENDGLQFQNYKISPAHGGNGQVLTMDNSNVASFQNLPVVTPDTNFYATHAFVQNNFLQTHLLASPNQVLFDSAGILTGSNNMLFYNSTMAPVLNVSENGNGTIATGQIQLSSAGVTIGIQGGGSSYAYLLPNADGTPGQYLVTNGSGNQSWQNPGWGLTGNTGTNPTTDFIGTTDGQPFQLYSWNGSAANSAGILLNYNGGISPEDVEITAKDSIRNVITFVSVNDGGVSLTSSNSAFDTSVTVQVSKSGMSIVDGTQGAGKVLTSDASGNASWSGKINVHSIQADNIFLVTDTAGTGDTIIKTVTGANEGVIIPNILTVGGGFVFMPGTQGAGKVLTSDIIGNASWQVQTDTGVNYIKVAQNDTFKLQQHAVNVIDTLASDTLYILLPANPKNGDYVKFKILAQNSTTLIFIGGIVAPRSLQSIYSVFSAVPGVLNELEYSANTENEWY